MQHHRNALWSRRSVAEYLAEESRHGGLGERVGALLSRVLGRGEAVLGATVHFHLPFDLGGCPRKTRPALSAIVAVGEA